MDVDDLVTEILTNARSDRHTIERVRDSLMNVLSSEDQANLGFATENVARLSEALTKINAQLVELVKVGTKGVKETKEKHADSIFDEISEEQEAIKQ
jgi:hypothetical protein